MADLNKLLEDLRKKIHFTMLTPVQGEPKNCEICLELGKKVKADWNVEGNMLCSKHAIELSKTTAIHKESVNSTN